MKLFKKRKRRRLTDLLHKEIKLQENDEKYDNILLYNHEEYGQTKRQCERRKRKHKKEHQQKMDLLIKEIEILEK